MKPTERMNPEELPVQELTSHYDIEFQTVDTRRVSERDWVVEASMGPLAISRLDVSDATLLRSINLCQRLLDGGFSNFRLPVRTQTGAHGAKTSRGLFVVTECPVEWPLELPEIDARSVGELLARFHMATMVNGLRSMGDFPSGWLGYELDVVPALQDGLVHARTAIGALARDWPFELYEKLRSAPAVIDVLANSVAYELHRRECQLSGAVVHEGLRRNSLGRGSHGQLLLTRPVSLRPGLPLEDLISVLDTVCEWDPDRSRELLEGYRAVRWLGPWEWPALSIALEFPWELVQHPDCEPGRLVRRGAGREVVREWLHRPTRPTSGEPERASARRLRDGGSSGDGEPTGKPLPGLELEPGLQETGETAVESGAVDAERRESRQGSTRKLVWRLPPPIHEEDHSE